jgi:hypothetical protein
MTEWGTVMRTRAWYRVFQVAQAIANGASLVEIKQRLIDAIEAVDKAEDADHGA